MASSAFTRITTLLLLLAMWLPPFTSQRPIKSLVVPVTKDPSTLQYILRLHQRTPLAPIDLSVDLGGRHVWVDCDQPGYVSSTYRPVHYSSAECKAAGPFSRGACYAPAVPGCSNNSCIVVSENPFTPSGFSSAMAQDVVSLPSPYRSNRGATAAATTIPRFIFACGSSRSTVTDGLAAGVKGVAGLGRSKISLPSQIVSAFSFPRRFDLCLSASTLGGGFISFGDKIIADNLVHTPLLSNPTSTSHGSNFFGVREPSYEYFIGVRSIKVNNKALSLNTTLLSIHSNGAGGTKISTVAPYTVLHTTIYKAVVDAFVGSGLDMVAPVAPFGACFDSKRVRPLVPEIDLVLQNKRLVWRISEAKSMLQVGSGVMCLGFVDGGAELRTSIVIGGYQLEGKLLRFDLQGSKLGFSSLPETTCGNFKFTANLQGKGGTM